MGVKPFHNAKSLHRNDIKHDNQADNLYWGTTINNATDMLRNNRLNTKLDFNKAQEIRKLCSNGQTQEQVAKMYNIQPSHVSNIVANRVWKQPDKEG